jgi:hypothetical protein
MNKITERIDGITLLTPQYRSPTPPTPKSVKIELTARSDFQCFFCASALRLRDKADIDPVFYRRRFCPNTAYIESLRERRAILRS